MTFNAYCARELAVRSHVYWIRRTGYVRAGPECELQPLTSCLQFLQVHVTCAAYIGPTFFVSDGADDGIVDGVAAIEKARCKLVRAFRRYRFQRAPRMF